MIWAILLLLICTVLYCYVTIKTPYFLTPVNIVIYKMSHVIRKDYVVNYGPCGNKEDADEESFLR